MNFKMLLSREPQDLAVVTAEMDKLTARIKEALPTLDDRREELLAEQQRLAEKGADDYFFTNDWEIDLGVFMDTGKTPSHYGDLEFYALVMFYIHIMLRTIMQRKQEVDDRLVTQADIYFFHVKDLAEQGNEEAKHVYEELKKVRPGGDKP